MHEAYYLFNNKKELWSKLQNRCRERILSNFKIDIMIEQNTSLWKNILKIES